ncbi:MAG: hypothetical protein IJL12_07885, partial [Selenomonadaceae bacterium]|nr:hypothetical protein [Selenomonadaceae bacterium]
MQFDEFKEGDFAVLQNVIQGMALAHYRQEEQLETEKGLLKQSLSDISHQIKTPLASITLTGEQLKTDEVSPAERKRYNNPYSTKCQAFTFNLQAIVGRNFKSN